MKIYKASKVDTGYHYVQRYLSEVFKTFSNQIIFKSSVIKIPTANTVMVYVCTVKGTQRQFKGFFFTEEPHETAA